MPYMSRRSVIATAFVAPALFALSACNATGGTTTTTSVPKKTEKLESATCSIPYGSGTVKLRSFYITEIEDKYSYALFAIADLDLTSLSEKDRNYAADDLDFSFDFPDDDVKTENGPLTYKNIYPNRDDGKVLVYVKARDSMLGKRAQFTIHEMGGDYAFDSAFGIITENTTESDMDDMVKNYFWFVGK